MKTKKNPLLPQVSAPVVRSDFGSSHNELGTGVTPSIIGRRCFGRSWYRFCVTLPFAGDNAK